MMKLRYTLLALCIGGLSPSLVSASTEDGLYAGIGLGLSRLNPNTDGTIYSVDDNRSTGGKLYLGYDINRFLSVEAYYADLGSADISPNGSLGYKDMGLNATYYLYSSGESREGLSAFARLGAGSMLNDTNLPYERSNDWHVMFGFGGEYGIGDGWAVRADLDLYDRDAQLFTLSLMKRFGSKPAPVIVEEPKPLPEPEPVVVINPDMDGDGILNDADACPETPAGTRVDATGCKFEEVMVLDGVTFASNSNELIGESHAILDKVAASLVRYSELRIEVGGHTDSQGPSSYNRGLSDRRANAVRDYLISKGVAAEVLSARGYGEVQPIADNKTVEGRAQNRRVELRMLDEDAEAPAAGAVEDGNITDSPHIR
ncbi:MAG: OmpA family protein [Pseudomonadota bacterium]